MNVLYYSMDYGEQAWQKAQEVVEEGRQVPPQYSPGQIVQIGQDAEGNKIFVCGCGVGPTEKVCRMAWIHALEQTGRSTAEWRFHRVAADKRT